MRLILFKGPVESLNHFVDELDIQLQAMGHETLVADVTRFDAGAVMSFCSRPVEGAVCYDGMCAFDKAICDQLNITMINIFMDHPMSFASCMAEPPARYVQLMPDEHHVEFARRFYHIENGFFLPHMASLSEGIWEAREQEGDSAQENNMFQGASLQQKEIPVLFPCGYRSVEELYDDINERFAGSEANRLALQVLEYLIAHPWVTMEAAMDQCLADAGMEMPDELIAYFLDHAKLLDHFIRMYFRRKVLETVIRAEIPVAVMGGNWRAFPLTQSKNVTILPNTNFTGVFPYMEKSAITLNVMPWFKAGTHDRIFNALLHNSCPLSDTSTWLTAHFAEDKECAYYSLEHLEKLPGQITALLENPGRRRSIIENGRTKVLNHYTSRQIAETILHYLTLF